MGRERAGGRGKPVKWRELTEIEDRLWIEDWLGTEDQVNQSDINRPEFGGWKGQSSALKKAAALVLAASLVLGSAVTSLAEEAGTGRRFPAD